MGVLIDGPTSGVPRQEWRIKEMNLTPIKVKFPFNARSKVVREEMEANKVNETWAASSWAKRMAMKKKRAGLTDLDRFKLRKASPPGTRSSLRWSTAGRRHSERLENCKSWKENKTFKTHDVVKSK